MWLLLFCLVGGVWGQLTLLEPDQYGTLIVSIENAGVDPAFGVNLELVIFNTSVTYIPEQAYFNSFNLNTALFPSTITSIGNNAFANCDLSFVQIPGSVTYIGQGAFVGNNNIQYVQINSGVINIDTQAFDEFDSNLPTTSTLVLPATILNVGEMAFDSTRIQTLIFMGTSATLQSNAFADLNFLSSFYGRVHTIIGNPGLAMEPNVTYNFFNDITTNSTDWLAAYTQTALCNPTTAFSEYTVGDLYWNGTVITNNSVTAQSISGEYCQAYITSLIVEEPATQIEAYALNGTVLLQTVDIAGTVTYIGPYAFSYAVGLQTIVIHEGLTTISANVFSGTNMSSVILPTTVSFLGANSFSNTLALQKVILLGDNITIESGAFGNTNISSFYAVNIVNAVNITICDTSRLLTGLINIVNCTDETNHTWVSQTVANEAPHLNFLGSSTPTTTATLGEVTGPTASPSPSSSSSLSTGAVLGIIVGLLIIVGAVGYFLYSRQPTIDSPNANTYKFL